MSLYMCLYILSHLKTFQRSNQCADPVFQGKALPVPSGKCFLVLCLGHLTFNMMQINKKMTYYRSQMIQISKDSLKKPLDFRLKGPFQLSPHKSKKKVNGRLKKLFFDVVVRDFCRISHFYYREQLFIVCNTEKNRFFLDKIKKIPILLSPIQIFILSSNSTLNSSQMV